MMLKEQLKSCTLIGLGRWNYMNLAYKIGLIDDFKHMETESMINGAIAKLTDLREGDRIRSEVRVDKKNKKKTPTALKIYVDRATTPGG